MASTNHFASVELKPPNAIFHLNSLFKADTNPKKLNLGIGAYRDECGKPYVFKAVQEAEQALLDAKLNKEYLPILGHVEFRRLAAELVFGDAALVEERVASCQTISGTGALCIAAHFLRQVLPETAHFLLPDPTWANHSPICLDAGWEKSRVRPYAYYDSASSSLDMAGMLAGLEAAPEGSAVLLHMCAQNPTGLDPTTAQWEEVLAVAQRKKHLCLFDGAYQGFASGDVDTDASPVRMFVAAGLDVIMCQSFAKNMGLYCERAGALHIVCADHSTRAAVSSNLEVIVRPMYSNPPAHGARIVAHVLGHAETRVMWLTELKAAAARIKDMRDKLVAKLKANGTPGPWDRVQKQRGMFSYTGLTPAQADRMVKEHAVYMLKSGRVNVAGLVDDTVDYCAAAMHEVITGVWPVTE